MTAPGTRRFRGCGSQTWVKYTARMASVFDPRKPKHLIPVLLGNWVNQYLSIGVSIYMITGLPKPVHHVFGVIGSVNAHPLQLVVNVKFRAQACASRLHGATVPAQLTVLVEELQQAQ